MRVGKFLSNFKAASRCRATPSDVLPFFAAAGEGTYYFLDQISWCGHPATHPSTQTVGSPGQG